MPKEERSAAEKYLALIFSPAALNRSIGPKQMSDGVSAGMDWHVDSYVTPIVSAPTGR
jgi:hypothetical protein